jgi:hypothetical protein
MKYVIIYWVFILLQIVQNRYILGEPHASLLFQFIPGNTTNKNVKKVYTGDVMAVKTFFRLLKNVKTLQEISASQENKL